MTIRTVPIGARGQYKVKVDARDYAWVTQWRWNFRRKWFCGLADDRRHHFGRAVAREGPAAGGELIQYQPK